MFLFANFFKIIWFSWKKNYVIKQTLSDKTANILSDFSTKKTLGILELMLKSNKHPNDKLLTVHLNNTVYFEINVSHKLCMVSLPQLLPKTSDIWSEITKEIISEFCTVSMFS